MTIKAQRRIYSAADVVGAIRLAMEAGADADVRSLVIRQILDRAPAPEPRATAPVTLLVEAMKGAKAEFYVTSSASISPVSEPRPADAPASPKPSTREPRPSPSKP